MDVHRDKPASMLLLLPLWLVLFAMLVGWGLLLVWALRRASGGAIRGALSVFQTMWLGYAGLITFLLGCSVVLPITRLVIVLAMIPACAGFAVERETVARRLHAARLRPRVIAVIAVVTLVAWLAVAYAACDHVTWYDTNLYHLQVVKWNATYSAVPGLANLHLRFGYNNSVHLFGALVDAFWQGVGVHAMNSFLIAATLAHWATEIFCARTPRGRLRQTYCMLTLPFLLAKLWTEEIASFSTDLPLALLCLVLLLELLSLPRTSRERLVLPLALILSLGAVATTTKLGGLALFGVAGIAALVLGRGLGRRAWLVLLGFPALLLVVWMIHGAIISGWLVFPVFGKLPLSWAVPSDQAAGHLRWIESWARQPQQAREAVLDHGFLHWFVPWFDGFRQSREMLLLSASAALLAFRVASGRGASAVRRAGEWSAVAACALGIVQWFVGAPDLRFCGFLFWALPALLFAPMIAGAMRDATVRSLVTALALAFCAWSGGFTPRLDAGPPRLLHRPPAPQRYPVGWRQTGPGTLISHPLKGDQCGDEDLLCAPDPGTQTLRDPSSLGAGFTWGPGS
jgi:hypothetical protein